MQKVSINTILYIVHVYGVWLCIAKSVDGRLGYYGIIELSM